MGNANNIQEIKEHTFPPTICHDYKCFQLSNCSALCSVQSVFTIKA